ncbi:MAG: sugar MFS transporter [Pseudomonadota bacterium]
MTMQTAEVSANGNVQRSALTVPLIYAISCFFIWGLAYGLLDVLNKHFQDTLGVGKAESTWLQIAYFGAYLTMSLPAGALLRRKGYKFGLLTGLCITAGGAFLFIPSAEAASFPFFVISMFVLATGLCYLETTADTYVNVLGPANRSEHRLNLAQSFNGLGAFMGPIIGGALFFGGTVGADNAHDSIQTTYAVIGVLVLLFAILLSRAHLPEIAEPESTHGDGQGALSSERHFVLGVTTQALYIGAQVGIGAFFINLVTETWAGLSSQNGAYMLSIGMLLFLVGRFVTTGLMTRFAPRNILMTYGIINTVLTVVVALGIQKVSAVALIAVFFFMSTMFATIFTLGVKDLGANTKRASSIMVMAIGGGVLLPYPMGLIAESFGTAAAFFLPAACFVLVAFYGWKGSQISRPNSKA